MISSSLLSTIPHVRNDPSVTDIYFTLFFLQGKITWLQYKNYTKSAKTAAYKLDKAASLLMLAAEQFLVMRPPFLN